MYKKGSDGDCIWKKTVTASYKYDSETRTAWVAKVVFPSKGKRRVRGYHATDGRNYRTYTSYDYVTVG